MILASQTFGCLGQDDFRSGNKHFFMIRTKHRALQARSLTRLQTDLQRFLALALQRLMVALYFFLHRLIRSLQDFSARVLFLAQIRTQRLLHSCR